MRGRPLIIIYTTILLFFASLLYAAEINKPLHIKTPSAKNPPSQVRKVQKPKQLPDLIVEMVWLDEQRNILFNLKNVGNGSIPDREHRQSWVRVQYGEKTLDFHLAKKNPGDRPPVDPDGELKEPGGVVTYNTGLKLKTSEKVSVIADCNKRIKESNEKNNQSKTITPKPFKKRQQKAWPGCRGARAT